jgi:hypothetical protein
MGMLLGGCGRSSGSATVPADSQGSGDASDAVDGVIHDVDADEPDLPPNPDSDMEDAADSDVPEALSDVDPEPDVLSDVDAEPDVPVVPPPTPFCDPCTEDVDCGGLEDRCLMNSQTGELFCAVDCSTTDGLCPPGGICFDLGEGFMQCVPPLATCVDHEPVSLKGQACAEAALCYGTYGTCISAGGTGYCTHGCEGDGDCGTGTSRCAEAPGGELVCRADWELGPEGCGWVQANSADIGGSCESGQDCGGGLCISENLPSTVGAPADERSSGLDGNGVFRTSMYTDEIIARGSLGLPLGIVSPA